MNTAGIRKKLHQFIDAIEDKKAEAIYTLFEDAMDAGVQRRQLIKKEREKYLRGEGKSFSPDEVKQMAVNREKRHEV